MPHAGVLRKPSTHFTSEQFHLPKSIILFIFPCLYDEIKYRVLDKAEMKNPILVC